MQTANTRAGLTLHSNSLGTLKVACIKKISTWAIAINQQRPMSSLGPADRSEREMFIKREALMVLIHQLLYACY